MAFCCFILFLFSYGFFYPCKVSKIRVAENRSEDFYTGKIFLSRSGNPQILSCVVKRYKQRLRLLSELFDETEAVNTAMSMTNAPFTYFALALPLIAVVASLVGIGIYTSLMLLLVVFMCVYPDIWLRMRVKEKNEAIL